MSAHPENKEAECQRLRVVREPRGTKPLFLTSVIPTFSCNENKSRHVTFIQF